MWICVFVNLCVNGITAGNLRQSMIWGEPVYYTDNVMTVIESSVFPGKAQMGLDIPLSQELIEKGEFQKMYS